MASSRASEFPNPFNTSPFNSTPFADHELEDVGATLTSFVPNRTLRLDRKRLLLRKSDYIPKSGDCYYTDKGSVRALILVRPGSDASVNKGGEISNLAQTLKFSAEDYVGGRLHCLSLGLDLMVSIELSTNSLDKNLKLITKWYLEWVFRGDENAQEAYFKELRDAAHKFYQNNRLGQDMTTLEKIVSIVIGMLDDILKKILSEALAAIAKLIRLLKLNEPKSWKPVIINGKKEYNPEFIPDISIDFSRFEDLMKHLDQETLRYSEGADWSGSKLNDEKSYYLRSMTLEFYFQVRNILINLYTPLKVVYQNFVEFSKYLNAFLVGLHNGIIELVAGIIELAATLLDNEKLRELIQGFKDLINKIKEEGVLKILEDIFDQFIKKYRDAESSYDIAKFLGEDLAEIILEVIIGIVTAGGAVAYIAGKRAAFATLKQLPDALKKLANDVSDSKALRRRLEEKPARKKVLNMEPRAFAYLNEFEKKAYQSQKKIISPFKKKDDIPKGKKLTGVDRHEADYTTYANWGEMSMDQYMLSLDIRWKPLHTMVDDINAPIKRGIDGIYENLDFKDLPPPPKYIIAETKSFSAQLNPKTKDGRQMSKKWIENRIEKILKDNAENVNVTKRELKELRRNISNSSDAILFEFKNVGAIPIVSKLDLNGERINKTIEYIQP